MKIDFTNLSWYEPEEFWWDWGDQSTLNYTNQKDTSIAHTFPKEGVYQICLRAKNNNGENIICKEIKLGTTGSKNFSEGIKLEICPNPASDFCIVNIEDYLPNFMTITFIDLDCNLHLSQRLFQGSNLIDIDSLNSGIYNMEIKEKGKLVQRQKVIKI